VELHERFGVKNLDLVYKDKIKNKTGKGVDGVNDQLFLEDLTQTLSRIETKVLSGKYRFTPYMEALKSKGRSKQPRIISKPTIRDKLTLSTLKDCLQDRYPESVDRKLPNTYVREIRQFIESNSVADLYFFKLDIKAFYDNIDRDILFDKLKVKVCEDELLTLIRRAIINLTVPKGYKKKKSYDFRTEKGVPQGLSISNILASIYLHEFDQQFIGGSTQYYRYVDDILVIAKKEEIQKIKTKVLKALNDLKLETNDKTEEGALVQGFDYLGYNVSPPQISVRESSVDRFIESLVGMFTELNYGASRWQKNSKWLGPKEIEVIFIQKLNEKITGSLSDNKRYGWLFYFIEINDMHLLHKLDAIMLSQFNKSKFFNGKQPKSVKSLVKSYYEARFNTLGGYIHNYSDYDTVIKKMDYLVMLGIISRHDRSSFSENEVERMFHRVKSKNLMKLEADIGNVS